MAWRSNGASVVAELLSQKASLDRKAERAASQGKVMMLNEVHTRMEGHIDTGNMNSGFDRVSKVEKIEDAHYLITITTDATNNGFAYPDVVERRYGMMGAGCHAAMPQVIENFKKVISE